MPLLEVRDLVTTFQTDSGKVHAVRGISYSIEAGGSLAIVGESGSGKTVSALSLMRLVPEPAGRIEGGEVVFGGRDLMSLTEAEMRAVRGREIAMIFQDAMTSLNPVLTIGRQLTEAVRHHFGVSRNEANARAVELLELVGVPGGEGRLAGHPHELSGGQRQRVLIAMALACRPSLLIADEPTTALDVTIQSQIVDLVKRLQRQLGMAVLWITHDLALVAGVVDRVAVMYAGSIVEEAPVQDLFDRPRHPYTLGLLHSLPGAGASRGDGGRLRPIEGSPPDLRETIEGCAFASRCPLARERCFTEAPPAVEVGVDHASACWRWQDVARPVKAAE